MRRFLWLLGLALVLAALVSLTVDVLAWAVEGSWAPTTLGAFWRGIDTNSLVGFGAFVEKEVDPDLWSGVLLPMLLWPLWIYPAVPGVVLAVLAWPRRNGDRKRQRRIFSRKR